MKTYANVIRLAAKQALDSFLAGNDAIWQQVDFDLIAYIFEKDIKQVEQDILKEYEIVEREHYAK